MNTPDQMDRHSASLAQKLSVSLENSGTAEMTIRRALRENPCEAEALAALSEVHLARGDMMEGIRLLQEAIYFDTSYVEGYRRLAHLLYLLRRSVDAAKVYVAWSEVAPDDPEVRHMAAASSGADIPDRASKDYIRSYFGRFASNFDQVLVHSLAYCGPEVIAKALSEALGPPTGNLDTLDAGCGTGLCGPNVRCWARSLVGVDLSEEMIARARARDVYDQLIVGDLVEYLNSTPDAFDLVVCSDVLVYFGDLESVMLAFSATMRANATLAFTVEAMDETVVPAPATFRLEPHGRYSHRNTYVHALATRCGFEVLRISQEALRREADMQVQQFCVIARKRQRAEHD